MGVAPLRVVLLLSALVSPALCEGQKAKPRLTVSNNVTFTGDNVTLSCVVDQSTGWSYTWYKGKQDTNPVTMNDDGVYTLSSATVSHSGEYWCRAERGEPVYYTPYSDPVQLRVTERPKAVLTVESGWTQLFSGETVTLRCDVKRRGITDWRYSWYKDGNNVYPVNPPYSVNDRYRISPITAAHSGEYTCKGERSSNSQYSELSSPVTVTVSGQPHPVLSVSPQGSLYEGESVTLSCRVTKSKGWSYFWYKLVPHRYGLDSVWYNSQRYSAEPLPDSRSGAGGSYTLSPAVHTHTGEYVCRAGRGSPVYYSQYSTVQSLQVSASFLTPDSAYSQRNHTQVHNQVLGLGMSPGFEGVAHCCMIPGEPVYYTPYSDAVQLQVTERPKAVLTVESGWTQLFSGETVTLRCDVKGGGITDWRYSWYKDGNNVYPVNPPYSVNDRYRISPITADNGEYTCKGERISNSQYSELSSPVTVTVSGKPHPVLSVSPQGSLYEGESVTLSCEVTESTGWSYFWYKLVPHRYGLDSVLYNSQRYSAEPLPDSRSGAGGSYTLSPAVHTHAGRYVCRAGRGSPVYYSQYSTVQSLQVSLHHCCIPEARPKALVSLEPPWTRVFLGETVSLSCGFGEGSSGWRYLWYRDSPQTSVPNTAAVRYTITAAAVSDQGQYWCQGHRGNQSFTSQLSDALMLNITELLPPARLIVSPSRSQHFTGQSLSLSCKVHGNSTGWTLKQHLDRGEKAGCLSVWGRSTGGGCDITYTQVSDSGLYWCESGSGERSYAVRITVHSGSIILEGPTQPVTEGDSLNLRCLYHYNSGTKSSHEAEFYKDGVKLTQKEGKINLLKVSKTDEGFYKCKHYWGESPESWMSVRELFSRVNLTVSPGAVLKEGQTLNLTCGAVVNKQPRPELTFSILRDNSTVVNLTTTESQVYSQIDGSQAGTYRCRVSGPTGIHRESEEIQVTVEGSWFRQGIVGVGVTAALFLLLTSLLVYHRIRGFPCRGKSTPSMYQNHDQNQSINQQLDPSGRPDHTLLGVELGNMSLQPVGADSEYANINMKNRKQRGTGLPNDDFLYSEVVNKRQDPGKRKSGTAEQSTSKPFVEETIYSEINLQTPTGAAVADDDVTYVQVHHTQKKIHQKKNTVKPGAFDIQDTLYSELKPAKSAVP